MTTLTTTDPGAAPVIADVAQLVGSGDSLITVGGPREVQIVRLSAEQREALITALIGHRRYAPACAAPAVAGAVA